MSEHKGPRRMGHGPGGMVPGEKAKNFKGTVRKLLQYMLVKSAAPVIIIPSLPSNEGKTAFLAIGNLLFRGGFCRGERPGRMETGREAMSRQRRSSRRVRKASPGSRSMVRNCSRSLEIVRF